MGSKQIRDDFSGGMESFNIVNGINTKAGDINAIYEVCLKKDIPVDKKNVHIKYSLSKLKSVVIPSKMSNNADSDPPSAITGGNIGIEFHMLSYTVQGPRRKEQKTILNSVSGKFEPGRLVGILGPSGAGKTTLMSILAGFKTSNVSGSIKVNGQKRNVKCFRGQSCFIMQDESLLKFLSVEESMQIAVTLKLGDKVSKEESKIVIDNTLETMRLTTVKLSRVGSLSGGERKRLSIALELVSNPPMMLFDEPTSGLDSLNSFHCVNMLKDLAAQGKTVICTIHQPSAKVFEMFDQIYAMAEGHCIYDGTSKALIPFLSARGFECPSFHNPADFLIEVASNQYGPFISKLSGATETQQYKCGPTNNYGQVETDGKPNLLLKKRDVKKVWKSEDIKLDIVAEECLRRLNEESPEKSIRYPASFYTQCHVLFVRTFKSIWRDAMLTLLRFAAHLVTGLLIGALYYKIGNEAANIHSNMGFLFFNLLFLLFTAMMPTIVTFPLEMPVFVREHFNHWYSLGSYYISKTMADFPFQVVFPVMYVSIVYFMTAQPMNVFRFLLLTYFTIMTSLVAQSVGLAVGAAVDIQHAVFCGPVVSVPALLFSGFFVSFKTMPAAFQWFSYLSYLRYGYEGSLIAIYGLNREKLECSEAFCEIRHPEKVFDVLGINEDFLFYDALILFLYFIFVRILGYYVLKWKLSRQS